MALEEGSRKKGWLVVEATPEDLDELVECAGADAQAAQKGQLTRTLDKKHEDGFVRKVLGRDGSRPGRAVGYANWIKNKGQWGEYFQYTFSLHLVLSTDRVGGDIRTPEVPQIEYRELSYGEWLA